MMTKKDHLVTWVTFEVKDNFYPEQQVVLTSKVSYLATGDLKLFLSS